MVKVFLQIFSIACGLICATGCSDKDSLAEGCVQARYLRISDSSCGGTDKIEIIQGKRNILALFPNLVSADSLIVTANVPERYKTRDTVFYFTPEIGEPRVCNAMVAWYPEVKLIGISEKACL